MAIDGLSAVEAHAKKSLGGMAVAHTNARTFNETIDRKVAIITGASSGIGYEAARLFASKGARLVVTGRRRDALDALVGEIEAAAVKP